MNMLAMQLGLQALPERPKSAPVRTHRLRVHAAKTPDLPPAASDRPEVLRMRQQRKDVLQVMAENGVPMRRDEIAGATGYAERTISRRLTELKTLRLVRVERVSRRTLWELVDQEDSE